MSSTDADESSIIWTDEASSILKSILARRRIKYADLVNMLDEIGVTETKGTIANKLSRGTFSFIFFIQCMKVLGIEQINIDEM